MTAEEGCPKPPVDDAGAPKENAGADVVGVCPNGVDAPNGAGEMGDCTLSAGFCPKGKPDVVVLWPKDPKDEADLVSTLVSVFPPKPNGEAAD